MGTTRRRRRKSPKEAQAQREVDKLFSGGGKPAPSEQADEAPSDAGAKTKAKTKPKAETKARPTVVGKGVKLPKLRPGLKRIVDKVFDLDDDELFEAFESARDEIRTSDEKLGLELTRQEANEVQDRARKAHKLYVNALLVLKRFQFDSEVVQSAMWDAANAELQDEKDNKKRSKSITNDDVRYRAAQMFPDEWVRNEEAREQAKLVLKHLERVAELWKDRSLTLSSLVRSAR